MPVQSSSTLPVLSSANPGPVKAPTGKIVLTLLLLLLLVPMTCHAFKFSNLVDDVGKAVQSGINSIEEQVKQVLPAEEKEKQATPPTTSTSGAKKPAGVFVADEPMKTTPAAVPASQPAAVQATATAPETVAPAGAGVVGSVFSPTPIDPANPPPTTLSFTAGERIYGMLKAQDSWKKLVKNSDYLMLHLFIDGTEKSMRTVGLKRAELLARDYFVIDIAPEPAAMTNYTDTDIVFPSKDGYRFGPELFTKYLSELPPGEHRIRLEVKSYGDVHAAGEFIITGSDFSVYAPLLSAIKDGAGKLQQMPQPGKTDAALQEEMLALLKNAGWPEVRRLLIVDRDWWINRVAGGNSAVSSRHIQAAAAARESDGSFFFCLLTFEQPALLGGGWGKLQLARTGEKKPIPEENINK